MRHCQDVERSMLAGSDGPPEPELEPFRLGFWIFFCRWCFWWRRASGRFRSGCVEFEDRGNGSTVRRALSRSSLRSSKSRRLRLDATWPRLFDTGVERGSFLSGRGVHVPTGFVCRLSRTQSISSVTGTQSEEEGDSTLLLLRLLRTLMTSAVSSSRLVT